MIIYRPHRGGLAESMAEAREFESVEDMKEYIVQQHTDEELGPAFSADDIVFGVLQGTDSRIGWHNQQYVYTRRYYGEHYPDGLVIGMCSYDYRSLEQSQRMCMEFLEG